MRPLRWIVVGGVVAIFVVVAGTHAPRAEPAARHPLLDYVSRPDSAFQWEKASALSFPGEGTLLRLNMTSQVWQGIPWKHEVSLIRPGKPRYPETALLLVTGGRPSTGVLTTLAEMAGRTGMPVAVLWDIPNQPLFDNLNEDALISHTFVQFLKTKDKTWPLLYPMTKSAVRAMDALQAAAQQEWQSPIKGFVVTGASKRGWTTWLTGAVDPRVVGIAPMVYDNLNLKAQMDQQLALYGTYSAEIDEYSTKGLPQLLASAEGRELANMVDPYALRDRITMPKLIVNGSNDPYWTLESANLYFGDLLGDNRILYVPNAGHGVEGQRTFAGIGAFAAACARKETLPKVEWSYRETPAGLDLTIRPAGKPALVTFWTATSETKDFRKARWGEQQGRVAGTAHVFTLAKPKSGYAAIFGEVAYGEGGQMYWISTTPKTTR